MCMLRLNPFLLMPNMDKAAWGDDGGGEAAYGGLCEACLSHHDEALEL